MFITHKPAEIFLSAYLGDGTTQYWQYVEQTNHCPWFYVSVGRQQDAEALTSMVMLPSISAFEKLLNEQGADIWLLDAQLVSPAYLNGSDGWKMERLLEVRETVGDTSEEAAYVYSLEGGISTLRPWGPAHPTCKILVSFFRLHRHFDEHETNMLERLKASSTR